MPVPQRLADGDYHFHVYDYAASITRGPWMLSDAQPLRNDLQFYSMVRDLNGLLRVGQENGVPAIMLNSVGVPTGSGRRTMVLSFGSNAPNAPTVVITGGIHAREWIAPEFVYLLAEYLIMHYSAAPRNRYQRLIRNLVNSRRIYIIPMLNPDGNVYTVNSVANRARLWRKNRRVLPTTAGGAVGWLAQLAPLGMPNQPFTTVQAPPPGNVAQYRVPEYDPGNRIPPNGPAIYTLRTLSNNATGIDLNRNCTTGAWGYDVEIQTPTGPAMGADPSCDLYFGTAAASELETGNHQQALFQAANAGNPPGLATMIDYHSYGQFILYPSEASNNDMVGSDYSALGRIMRRLVWSPNVPHYYRLGSPSQCLYNATGTIIDHAAQNYHARAFTIELDPALGNADAFALPENQIRTVFEKNIRGALAAIAAPGRPATATTRIRLTLTQLQFLMWNVYGCGNQLPA